MKKIIAFLLVLCFVLTAVSCKTATKETDTPATDTEETNETNETADAEQANEPDAESAEPEPVTLSGDYQHVIVIGVDGAGAFFKEADTPNLDRIFENGAVTYSCLTANPTISAQCWGSLLLGVTPEFHGLNNTVVGEKERTSDTNYPSVFRLIREAVPNAVLASFCNWSPINDGIVENDIGVKKGSGNDSSLTQKIVAYLEKNQPTYLFVQFDGVDHAGHTYGYGTEDHLAAISEIDGYIGDIYAYVESTGILDDTLFIVTADHGGFEKDHGGLSDGEKYVMFAASGKTVVKGEVGDMEIRDVASIVLYALGLADKQTERMTSRVPSGLFRDVEAVERPTYEITFAYDYRTKETTETPALSDGVVGLLGEDRVTAYFSFDNDCEDKSGHYDTSTAGKIYYPEGYYGSAARFDDGYATVSDYKVGEQSVSFAFWMKTAGVTDTDPSVFSNKDWSSGANNGFILALEEKQLKFNFGDGSMRMDGEFALPEDYQNGWVYVVAVVDRENAQVKVSYDFGKFISAEIPFYLKNDSMEALPTLCIGQDGTGAYSASLPLEIDELVMVNGVLTDDDVAALRSLYVK